MTMTAQDLLRRLATVEPIKAPEGEPGVAAPDLAGASGSYLPVLSIYLDPRPRVTGAQPFARPGQVVLKERLRQIERTFWPRGAALDALRADAARIQRYIETRVAPDARGLAIFASEAHHLFEAMVADTPFDNQISARAVPDLFQLARMAGASESIVVAIVTTHAARLFVATRGGVDEVRGTSADPKFTHMVRGTNAMNQAHYQRHAQHWREEHVHQLARQVEGLVLRTGAVEVVLAGEPEMIPLLRQTLAPDIARRVHEPPLSLGIEVPTDAVLEEVAPLLREFEARQATSIVERLAEAVRADALGVVGLEPTRRALELGQVDVLVLGANTPLPQDARSALIAAAATTDASVEVVEESELFEQLGGVGALLRYRMGERPEAITTISPAPELPARQ